MSLFSVQNCVFCVFFDPAFGCYTAINVCVNDPFALTDKADCDSKKTMQTSKTDRQTDGRTDEHHGSCATIRSNERIAC